MNAESRVDSDETTERDLEEDIYEYIHRLQHCSSRSQAISVRTHALGYIDRWRAQRLQELDARVRTVGQLILDAFDECQGKRQRMNCSYRSKPTATQVHPTTVDEPSENGRHPRSAVAEQKVEISLNMLRPSSPSMKKIAFHSIDFGRDYILETLAHLPSSTPDAAMVVCQYDTLIYAQNGNELVILSLVNPQHSTVTYVDKNSLVRDLCYVDWLSRCLVITDEHVHLLDYRTMESVPIDSGIGYICGAIDNHRCIFYLVKQSTIYRYDKSSRENLHVDQYPIADGFSARRIALDSQTNDHLALLVLTDDGKNYILVYSTVALADGYLYKIMIDDPMERTWLCPSGHHGWLVRGTSPGSCFDIDVNGLCSVRVFECDEIRNMIPTTANARFIIRTKTDIFAVGKRSPVPSILSVHQ